MLPVEASASVPALEIPVPATVSDSPFAIVSVLPFAMVRLEIVVATFSVTEEPLLMVALEVEPTGTPLSGTTSADQSLATFHRPDAPQSMSR